MWPRARFSGSLGFLQALVPGMRRDGSGGLSHSGDPRACQLQPLDPSRVAPRWGAVAEDAS